MASSIDEQAFSTYAQLGSRLSDRGVSHEDKDQESAIRDLETVINRGNLLFESISLVDRNWHTEVYEDKTPYDEAEETEITGYYRTWLASGEGVLDAIRERESLGHSVAGAAEFLRNCQSVQGLLTDDAAFFGRDALAEHRDQAIDDHRAGRTIDFHVLGE